MSIILSLKFHDVMHVNQPFTRIGLPVDRSQLSLTDDADSCCSSAATFVLPAFSLFAYTLASAAAAAYATPLTLD